jgi:hypothetical protein
MEKRKAYGHRGSWFAEVDGESLPCVHRYWWRGGRYHDPNFQRGGQWDDLLEGLRSKGRAILTDDETPDGGGSFRRLSYIAVYSIDDVEVRDDGLHFRFVERLENLA